MMNPCNPLAISNLDDHPEDFTFYGEDPEAQTHLEEFFSKSLIIHQVKTKTTAKEVWKPRLN